MTENIIVGTLTYHGGTETISYPWGSFNHIGSKKNDEAPDFKMFDDISWVLWDKSQAMNMQPYMRGSLTDTVYACYGAMEDWAYGVGFDTTKDS